MTPARRFIVSVLGCFFLDSRRRGQTGNADAVAIVNLYFMSANDTAAVAGIPVTPAEQAQLARSAIWGSKGTAYVREHGTRPSTIALALSTNPLAMLSW
jgi:microsomal epoxide hydrolase